MPSCHRDSCVHRGKRGRIMWATSESGPSAHCWSGNNKPPPTTWNSMSFVSAKRRREKISPPLYFDKIQNVVVVVERRNSLWNKRCYLDLFLLAPTIYPHAEQQHATDVPVNAATKPPCSTTALSILFFNTLPSSENRIPFENSVSSYSFPHRACRFQGKKRFTELRTIYAITIGLSCIRRIFHRPSEVERRAAWGGVLLGARGTTLGCPGILPPKIPCSAQTLQVIKFNLYPGIRWTLLSLPPTLVRLLCGCLNRSM